MTMQDWLEVNQRHLSAELARVRGYLERGLQREVSTAPRAEAAAQQSAAAAPSHAAQPSALDQLCDAFALSPFERDLLLLCAGVTLDSAFADCLAALSDGQRRAPTFGLALAALPDSHWSALLPAAPLRRWRLIEVESGSSLTASPLRIDERVLHHLAGLDYLDERLDGLLRRLSAPTTLAPSQQAAAKRIAGLLRQEQPPVVQIHGGDPATRRALAARACALLGAELFALRSDDIPSGAAERAELACLWEREALLSGRVLLLACDGATCAAALVEDLRAPLLVSSRDPLRSDQRPSVRVAAAPPTAAEQRSLWRAALGSAAERLNGQIDAVAAQFQLSAGEIDAACREARLDGEPIDASALWDACRDVSRPRLDDLAQRIMPAATWQDLVLPQAHKAVLRDIAVHLRHQGTVYERWGFAAKGERGLGISALFAGPSGTGKTMAAEVLANELRLDLYRIDLSAVVSKYIGETEKNLRRVFDAAQEGGAILLFDEADALFGKRSEVKDSHDRYANIEVSYLLQRMELYRGLAILTTNMKSALDSAFLRRIRFVIEFPFPDTAQRAEIWRRVFPPAAPTCGVEAEKLARLHVAGGNIRNIALHAAFHAADVGEPVTMAHLLRAARAECAKTEKPLSEAEIAGWV
jgi:hypothetical protein